MLRMPILRGMGSFLIAEDAPERVEALVVLGGSSFDRAQAAANLYEQDYTPLLLTVGENVPSVLQVLDTILTEAQLSQIALKEHGVPTHAIVAISVGTSTMEESEAILAYCQQEQITSLAILSDKFHLRRTRGVFEDKFEEAGIKVIFCGASSSRYEEEEWWRYEAGLIMVSNEYMKLIYYFLKY